MQLVFLGGAPAACRRAGPDGDGGPRQRNPKHLPRAPTRRRKVPWKTRDPGSGTAESPAPAGTAYPDPGSGWLPGAQWSLPRRRRTAEVPGQLFFGLPKLDEPPAANYLPNRRNCLLRQWGEI